MQFATKNPPQSPFSKGGSSLGITPISYGGDNGFPPLIKGGQGGFKSVRRAYPLAPNTYKLVELTLHIYSSVSLSNIYGEKVNGAVLSSPMRVDVPGSVKAACQIYPPLGSPPPKV